ncbi:MAG: hypothetical protein JXR94_08225 [Candidatus Hydrogenedentes bacterium]|nr:hypothetical protein [Candidatus Hydrogenedentota bacterium]
MAFGWQGVEADTPAGWELGAYEGDFRAGHACLDDGTQLRFRVRWHDGAGRPTPLQTVLNRYRRSVLKSSKDAEFCVLDPEALPVRFRKDKTMLPFSWEAGVTGQGVVWRCAVCRRIVVAEVMSPPGEEGQKAARRILASVRCHRDDDERLWAVYGFAFRTPDSYNLNESALHSGRLLFSFQGPRQSWLVVERWGLASQLLAKASLDAWPRELLKLRPTWRVDDLDTAETAVPAAGGGPYRACRFSARVRRRRGGVFGSFSRPAPVAGLVWHHADEDKIVAVMAATGDEDSTEHTDLVTRVAGTAECR